MDKHISLSPCPFCGEKLFLDIDDGGGVAILHSLKEKDCFFPSILEIEMPVGTTLEQMIEKINHRPIQESFEHAIVGAALVSAARIQDKVFEIQDLEEELSMQKSLVASREQDLNELHIENAKLKSEIVNLSKKVTDYEKELRQLQSDWQDVPRVSVRRTYWMPFKTSWAAPAVNKRYLVKLQNDWVCIATYYIRVGGGYWIDDKGQELTDDVVEFWKGLEE